MSECVRIKDQREFSQHTTKVDVQHPLCRLATKVAPSAALLLTILASSIAAAGAFLVAPLALTHVIVPGMMIVGVVGIVAVLIMVLVTAPIGGLVLFPLAFPFLGLLLALEIAPTVITIATFAAPIGAAASLGLGMGSAATIGLAWTIPKAIQAIWGNREGSNIETSSESDVEFY